MPSARLTEHLPHILSAFKRRAAGQYRKLDDSGLDVRKEAKALGIKGFA